MRQNGRGNVSINEKREKKLPVSFILSIVKPRLTTSVFSIIIHTAQTRRFQPNIFLLLQTAIK